MPFRLCNAPTTFQRLMQKCLGELNLTHCLIYLDDVIVLSKTEEEHLQHLHIVFNHLWEYNLRLKPNENSSGMRLTTWPIMSLRRACSPAKRI